MLYIFLAAVFPEKASYFWAKISIFIVMTAPLNESDRILIFLPYNIFHFSRCKYANLDVIKNHWLAHTVLL